jgi:hypothetical protein
LESLNGSLIKNRSTRLNSISDKPNKIRGINSSVFFIFQTKTIEQKAKKMASKLIGGRNAFVCPNRFAMPKTK